MRIVVAITGSSACNIGVKLIDLLPKNIEKHVVVSKSANVVLKKENGIFLHDQEDIAASISSGSFNVDAMIITPCSMNTLAKIACGICDNLITRSAAVTIKERRDLLLAPREMPYSPIFLENMLKLSQIGVIISPPVMAYYSNQKTLEDMENFVIGKWFDILKIEHNLYDRWK